MSSRYASSAAFRRALEAGLKRQALAEGRDLNRLRQLVLFERVRDANDLLREFAVGVAACPRYNLEEEPDGALATR